MVRFSIALDTCVGEGSLALYGGGKLVAERIGFPGREGRPDAFSAIQEVLRTHSATASDLKELFLTKGPGSFTGVRTGLSLAAGLTSVLDINVYSCTVFEALSAVECQVPFCTGIFAGSGSAAVQFWTLNQAELCPTPSAPHKIVEIGGLLRELAAQRIDKLVAGPRLSEALLDNDQVNESIEIVRAPENISILARKFIQLGGTRGGKDIPKALYTREFHPGK